MALATIPGYPSADGGGTLQKALEDHWRGRLPQLRLLMRAAEVQREHWRIQREAGLDLIPVGDFTLYDPVLDTIAMLGAVPERYEWEGEQVDTGTYFAMARGSSGEWEVRGMDSAPWFGTNERYILPELSPDQRFRLGSEKVLEDLSEAQAEGVRAKPVLLGPVTFLLLSKPAGEPFPILETLLPKVLPVYARIVTLLSAADAEWIQLDEPILTRERTPDVLAAMTTAYRKLAAIRGRAKLLVQTAYGAVGEAYDTLVGLPVEGIGLDLASGPETLRLLEERGFPAEKWLAAGMVDGRSVEATDVAASLDVLRQVIEGGVSPDRLMVSASCSLRHLPPDARTEGEQGDPASLAERKVAEVVALTRSVNQDGGTDDDEER